jgi:hypothetical protein
MAKGCAFHHHHGAALNIPEGDGERQRKIDAEFPPSPDVIDVPSGLKGVEFMNASGSLSYSADGMTPYLPV